MGGGGVVCSRHSETVYDGDDSDDYVCYDDNERQNDGCGTDDDAVAV